MWGMSQKQKNKEKQKRIVIGFWGKQMSPRIIQSIAIALMVSIKGSIWIIWKSYISGDVKSALDWLHTFPGSKIGLSALLTFPK